MMFLNKYLHTKSISVRICVVSSKSILTWDCGRSASLNQNQEKKMNNSKVIYLVHAAAIAALYVVLTFLASMMGLSSGAIQVRFSEALTILPFFTPAAVPGLFIGCLLSNILTGCALWDVVFGSLATLAGAVATRLICKGMKNPWAAPIPPIIANMIIVPQVLMRVYMLEGTLLYFTATVGAGEVISCGIMGMVLLFALKPHADRIFHIPDASQSKILKAQKAK